MNVEYDLFKQVNRIIMLNLNNQEIKFEQLSVAEGIERHGNKAIAAIVKEYEQLRDLDTVMPLHADRISKLQKRRH